MISKRYARKVWPRDTTVIRRGDAGWESDHPARRGESYGHNPTSRMDKHIRVNEHYQFNMDHLPNPDDLPLDARAKTEDGPDIIEFRVCIRVDATSPKGRHVWRYWARHRNAAR